MKYCQKCGKPAEDSDFICPDPKCKGHLASNPREDSLSDQQITTISERVWETIRKKHLRFIFGEFCLLLVLSIWGIVQAYNIATNKLSELMVTKINAEFETPRIRAAVSEVASNQAKGILISEIQPEVKRFENQISTQINQVGIIASNAISSLYSSMVRENFSLGDTNHLKVVGITNDCVQIIVRLSHFPISGSVESYVQAANSIYEPLNATFIDNVSYVGLWNYDTNSLKLTFRYLIDQQKTNYYYKDRMPKWGEEVIVPGEGKWSLLNVTK